MNTSGADYRNLFESNPFPLIIYDAESFRILEANTAASDLYGYTHSELLSFKLDDLFYDDSLNEINSPDNLYGSTRVYHKKKDGTRISLRVRSTDIKYDSRPARLETIITAAPEPTEDYLRLLLSSIVESSDDAIISKGLDGRILSWNRGAEKMYGYKAEEVIGRNISIIVPHDIKDEIAEILDSIVRGEKYEHYETRRITKDERILWVSVSISPLRNSAGEITGASSIARNISRARETLARLEENEIIFRHLIENLSEVFYVSDQNKPEILYISNAYEKVFGEPVENIYKNPKGYLEFVVKEDVRKALKAIAKQRKGIATDYTFRIKRADGSIRVIRERAFPIKDKTGKVFRVIGVAEDITARLESEDALRKSEYRYRSIFESTAVAMFESDYSGVMARLEEMRKKGISDCNKYFDEHPGFVNECAESIVMVDVNPKSVEMFKARNKRTLLNDFKKIRTREFDAHFRAILTVLAQGKKHFESEFRFQTFSGEPISVYLIMTFPEDNSYYKYTVISIIDITERKRAERALSESEQRFRVMADTAPVLIWTAGPDKLFNYFNKPWLDFAGRRAEDESGEGWMKRIHPTDLHSFINTFIAAFEKREEFRQEYRITRYDGQERWLLTHAVPRFSNDGSFQGYIGSSVDITERKMNEVKLSKALASEKHALKKAGQVQEKLRYLAEASIILNSSLDYTLTIQSLARLLTPDICDWFAADLYSNDKFERLVVYHKDPEKIEAAIKLQKKYTPDMNDAIGIPKVLKSGKAELYKELSDEFIQQRIGNGELYHLFRELGVRSMMIVPLKVRNRVLGTITLSTAESGKNYNEEDLEFAENIAHRAAIAIDNAYLFRQIEELNKNLEYTVKQQLNEIKYRKKIEKELRESEERFRLITENSNDFISLLNEKNVFIYANPAITRVLGYKEDELVGKINVDDLIHPDDREQRERHLHAGIMELRYRRKDGEYVWVESSSLKVNYHGEQVTIRISRDITERKRIENERIRLYSQLEAQRIRIDNLIANVPGVVWETYGRPNERGQKLSFISNYVEKLTGYPVKEWLNTPNFWMSTVHPDDRVKALSEAEGRYREKRGGISRYRWVAKDGAVIWIEAHSTPIIDQAGYVIGLRGVNMDITEQVKFEQRLSSSLKEKEILLKEIHHRVKNNMQVISSLLSLQAKTIPDEKTQEIFDESRNRIRSMALIHEKLYQSNDLFRIDLKSYVVDLLENLMISYGQRTKKINAEVNIDDITFDIDSAITLGLIINELASNSYKHAFINRLAGRIEVNISRQNENYVLTVKDDGEGIPEGTDIKRNDSLGLQLVDTLITQLYGKFEIANRGGTEVRIEFPDPAGEQSSRK